MQLRTLKGMTVIELQTKLLKLMNAKEDSGRNVDRVSGYIRNQLRARKENG